MPPLTPAGLDSVDVELLALLDSPSRPPASLGRQILAPPNSPVRTTPPACSATQGLPGPVRTATSTRHVSPIRNTSTIDTEDGSKLRSDGNDTEAPADESLLGSGRARKPKTIGGKERSRGGKSVISSDESHAVVHNTFAQPKTPRSVQHVTPQKQHPTTEDSVSNAEHVGSSALKVATVPDVPTADQRNSPLLPETLVTLYYREHMWRATSGEPVSHPTIRSDSDGNADEDHAAKTSERFALLQEEISRLKAELDQKDGETKARMEQLQQRWRAEAGMMIAVERKMMSTPMQRAVAERNAALGIARMDAGYWKGQCGRLKQQITEMQKKREIEETWKTAVAKPTTQAAASQRSLDKQYYAAEELKTASSQSIISADMLQTAIENMRYQQQEVRNQQGHSYDVAIRDCRIACVAALAAEQAKQYSSNHSGSGPVQPELAASPFIPLLAESTGSSQATEHGSPIEVESAKLGNDVAIRKRLELVDSPLAEEHSVIRKSAETGTIARASWKQRAGKSVWALTEEAVLTKGETSRLPGNVEPMEPDLGHSREGRLHMDDTVAKPRDEALSAHLDKDKATGFEEGFRLSAAQCQVASLRKDDQDVRARRSSTSDDGHDDDTDSRPTAEDIMALRMQYGYTGSAGHTTPSRETRSHTVSRSSSQPRLSSRSSVPVVPPRYHPYAQNQVSPSVSDIVVGQSGLKNPPRLRQAKSAKDISNLFTSAELRPPQHPPMSDKTRAGKKAA